MVITDGSECSSYRGPWTIPCQFRPASLARPAGKNRKINIVPQSIRRASPRLFCRTRIHSETSSITNSPAACDRDRTQSWPDSAAAHHRRLDSAVRFGSAAEAALNFFAVTRTQAHALCELRMFSPVLRKIRSRVTSMPVRLLYMPTHKPLRINCAVVLSRSPFRRPLPSFSTPKTDNEYLNIINPSSTVHGSHALYLEDPLNADKRTRTSLRSCLSRSTRHG